MTDYFRLFFALHVWYHPCQLESKGSRSVRYERDEISRECFVLSGCHAGGGRAGGNVFITANGGTVSNCVIRNGRGLSNWDSGGGGVGMYGGLVTHCVISNNASHTNKGGAGAYVDGGTLANSLVTGNAFNGGGASDNGGVVSVQKGRVLNCTIAGNKSDFSCACAPDGRVAAVLVN